MATHWPPTPVVPGQIKFVRNNEFWIFQKRSYMKSCGPSKYTAILIVIAQVDLNRVHGKYIYLDGIS